MLGYGEDKADKGPARRASRAGGELHHTPARPVVAAGALLRNKTEKKCGCQDWGSGVTCAHGWVVREWPTDELTFERRGEGRSVQAEGRAWVPKTGVNFACAGQSDGASLAGRGE